MQGSPPPPRKRGGDPQPRGTACSREALRRWKVWGDTNCCVRALAAGLLPARDGGDTREAAGLSGAGVPLGSQVQGSPLSCRLLAT